MLSPFFTQKPMKKTYELIRNSELLTRFKVGEKIVSVSFAGALKGQVKRGGRFSTEDPELQKVMEKDGYFNTVYRLINEEESAAEKAKKDKLLREKAKAELEEELRLQAEQEAKEKLANEEEKQAFLDELAKIKESLDAASEEDKPGIHETLDAKQKEFDEKYPREVVDHPEIKTISDAKEFLFSLNIEGVNDETVPNGKAVIEVGLKHFHSFSKLKVK
jgi:polyribonucleotide nucleotidyltransferase